MEFESSKAKAEAYKAKQDETREKLSQMEDQILGVIASLMIGADRDRGARWLAIGRTHIEEGFMALKRGIYDGKRVGDP